MAPLARLLPPRGITIGVVAVTFFSLLISAGLRATPGVLMVPLTLNFGWSRASISAAAAIGILLYGLVGPFAAAFMRSYGIRRTMIGGLVLMSASTFASLWMSQPWHYVLTWGLLAGVGSGSVAMVLGSAIVNRWFATRQGLMMGLMSASTATGALIFLPFLAWLSRYGAWKPTVIAVCAASALLVPLVALLVPEHPRDAGMRRYGEAPDAPLPEPEPRPSVAGAMALPFTVLARGVRAPIFWLLFGTFFVCGLTTNGLVGTHLIAYCGDMGIAPVAAAGLLSLMGFFDLFGTTASGWLTDRYDPKKLLCIYYGLRGLSLMVLPFQTWNGTTLAVFAIFYGLDWIATVPPTVRLANVHFGERDAPILFGWILVGHQIGAAVAAYGAGLIRQDYGSYLPAFVLAGCFGVLASLAFLITPNRTRRLAVA
ncbi:MFS transporter [Sphingobium nicotianae]|uniref:MFS transporter n=1 Tax=Sphingobium nicotianae TaxID=2782607 RepID=A0A9X1D833_9SPHN|nr:MFS transporter [Sphingobium nicotianae]MBT2185852.1 MFS transporter [Sphingobium nicotianae]